jgi:hypothetical protein
LRFHPIHLSNHVGYCTYTNQYKRKKKETQAANNSNTPSTDFGVIRIGHYILGETLGTGSFGKVKSTSS